MRYGLVISAGNQTRFLSETPKALSKIGEETLLDINIRHMSKCCDRVIVICSFENEEFFKNYDHIAISSGRGCGDAVMNALDKMNVSSSDEVFIQWGDSVHKSSVYQTILDSDDERDKVLIPCVIEDKPYVQLIEDGEKLKVLFSKYGEATFKGYHDLSLFYCHNAEYLLNHLKKFRDKFWLLNGVGKNAVASYVHKHNNELQFLDVFNETDIKGEIINMGDYKDFAFNTIDELKVKIQMFEENK